MFVFSSRVYVGVGVRVLCVCAITSVTVHGLAARYPPYREFAGVIMLASV